MKARFSVFLLFFSPWLWSQHRIDGIIYDPSGALVPGAEIRLLDNGTILAQVYSDERGAFRLPSPVRDELLLHFERPGFRPATYRVRSIFNDVKILNAPEVVSIAGDEGCAMTHGTTPDPKVVAADQFSFPA